MSGVTRLSIIVLISVVALSVTFLTEITSNTATTALLMPILAAASLGAGFDPALLMLPAALSASCAFMLPVATAPNAIVFGTGRIRVEQMVKEGFSLNLIGAAVISCVVYFWLG
jgi:sodium-dependent dicarboxylate transporter 2/3/5